jgi:uncharacterized protein YdeI (YjbR/CyaY-like superfamily)
MARRTKTNPDVDDYIASAAPFARPILERIRKAFHDGEPEIEETIKWRFPHFERNGIVAGMAAFKEHVRFGFWKGKLMRDPAGILRAEEEGSMTAGRFRDVSELPAHEVLVDYVREAVGLNAAGVKVDRPKKAPAPPAEVPDDLANALKKAPAAAKYFASLAPSHKREYITWITEAKQPATREKRLATTIEWLSEGKPRNWKYMK